MNNNTDKTNTIRIYLPVIFALVLVLGVFVGLQLQRSQGGFHEKAFFSIKADRYDKINDVLNYINDAYVDSISRDSLTEEALSHMLQSLDPHSAYIPASAFHEVNDPLMGSFEGIGIEFNMISDTVVVISPVAGGPSEKVGIMAGDRIISVDGEVIAGVDMATSDVVSRLKGAKGTEVQVEILRRDVPDQLSFTIVRDKIPSYSLDIAYMITDDTGYIRLNKFASTTYQEFLTALNKLKADGMQRLIFDLRDNSGGFLDAAINIADELLETGKLIVYTDGRRRPKSFAYAKKSGGFETEPLVILINEWSASASEIIAGAVQDNDRGIVVGRRSFGKGLVQEQVQLADGSAVRLTVARYYTPTGRSIQRPYTNGQEEYYSDLMQRYLDGELEDPGNIHFDDSLQYTTPGGRIVYGGGGIMPDIFTPIDTGEHMAFFNQVSNRGYIYRFAFDYADKNREAVSRHSHAEDFVASFVVTDNMFAQFLKYVADQGMTFQTADAAKSQTQIKNHIKAYIGRNVFGNEAFFPVLNQADPTLQKALESIRDDNYTLSLHAD